MVGALTPMHREAREIPLKPASVRSLQSDFSLLASPDYPITRAADRFKRRHAPIPEFRHERNRSRDPGHL